MEIPLSATTDKGIGLLKCGDVTRVLCDYWLEREQKQLNYHDVIHQILCDDLNAAKPHLQSLSPLIHKIVKAFDKDQVSYMVSETQRLINDVVNAMPLHETDMNSWAMNYRLVIIDPAFDDIRDPNERLNYQVEKNRVYYENFGWTAIGLSESVLADKNYLLTTDLRLLTPFSQYHNPQRNLYSTLGMKGDELPRVRSQSMEKLIGQGISRKGWNMTTAILDMPMNFEDQILVDKRHLGLSHTIERRFVIFGEKLLVKKGDKLKAGDALGYCQDGQRVTMDLRCDEARVLKVRKDIINLNGDKVSAWTVMIEGKRFLRDGSKFSNQHGNKGVVRFLDLGFAVDPRTGEEIPIDVIISAKSIKRRKNFGQIFEALTNNVTKDLFGQIAVEQETVTQAQLDEALEEQRKQISSGDRKLIGGILKARYSISGQQIKAILKEQKRQSGPIVVEDNITVDNINLRAKLKSKDLPEDGTWMANTYCGEFQAIVGSMFWGVTKDAEDQLWDGDRTVVTNNRELRTSGLKFSHVEMKALVTRFGPQNPVLKEILSHSQGVEILLDEIRILRSAKGDIDPSYPVVDAKDVGFVDTADGIFHPLAAIKGTIVDEEFMPEGFALRLPSYFQVIIEKGRLDNFTWGLPQEVQNPDEKIEYMYNTIFVPNALIRRCWRHASGKWGLNTVGAHLNRIIICCHKFIISGDVNDEMDLMRAISRYFGNIARSMGGKTGELSTYGMAVRYPYSSRAIAVLSEDLPDNTIEIHRDMANILKVKTRDVVLAERYPCLGFMSLRPQYVKVSDNPQCKNVIRVNGNNLISMNLDFDGDTLFLASFHTPQAIEALRKEMTEPNELCDQVVKQMNSKKVPEYCEMTLDDFNICRFPKPNNDDHAEIVRKATGVKSHTGPVIALVYNLMRIVEKNVDYSQVGQHVNLEVLLDFLGNSVFQQKHGIRSLQEEATDAICTADVEKMAELGFEREPSQLLCNLIKKEAASIKVFNLARYHQKAKENGWSKIINRIVREKNKVYFASRATLGPFNLLEHLMSPPVDLPSFMLSHVLRSQKEKIEEKIERIKASRMKIKDVLDTDDMRDAYEMLASYIDKIMVKEEKHGL